MIDSDALESQPDEEESDIWKAVKLDDIRTNPPDERCIYCAGLSENMTEDHVPPDNLYNGVAITHEKITAPACFTCNNNRSKDDEHFRNIIVPYCAKDSSVAANLLAGKVSSGVGRSPRLKKEDYDRHEELEQITPSGIYLVRSLRFTFSPAERACMLRLYDRLSKAMYWYTLRKNPSGRSHKLLEANESIHFMEGLKKAPTQASGNPEVFQYRAIAIGEQHEFLLVWSCFFKKLSMVSISGPPEEIRKKLEAAMKAS